MAGRRDEGGKGRREEGRCVSWSEEVGLSEQEEEEEMEEVQERGQ